MMHLPDMLAILLHFSNLQPTKFINIL